MREEERGMEWNEVGKEDRKRKGENKGNICTAKKSDKEEKKIKK